MPNPTSCEIPLTRGYVAKVDAADFERLNAHKWYASITKDRRKMRVYAARTQWIAEGGGKKRVIFMHRAILGDPAYVDHIDGDGLNNRRGNLRACTNRQNCANSRGWKQQNSTSRYRGVFKTPNGRWTAQINRDSMKRSGIGTFLEECDAALAYNLVAEEVYGEFARFNEVAQ